MKIAVRMLPGLVVASAAAVLSAAAAFGAGAAAWHSDAVATEAERSAVDSHIALATIVDQSAIQLRQWRAQMMDTAQMGAKLQQQRLAEPANFERGQSLNALQTVSKS